MDISCQLKGHIVTFWRHLLKKWKKRDQQHTYIYIFPNCSLSAHENTITTSCTYRDYSMEINDDVYGFLRDVNTNPWFDLDKQMFTYGVD